MSPAPSAAPDLAARDLRPEIMDDPALDAERHHRALAGLARINALSRSAAALWRPIADLARTTDAPLRLLDVATGGGDVPIRLARRARRAGIDLELEACDVSPRAAACAEAAARRADVPLRVFVHDAVTDPWPADRWDVVTCSLFLHHLDEADAVAVLRGLATAARRLVLVDDLRRGRAGLLLARVGTRLLSRSDVVRADGPQSVRAAFTPAELADLARVAGLDDATITPHWPARMRLAWTP